MYDFAEIIHKEEGYNVKFSDEVQTLRLNMRNNNFAYSLGISLCGPLYVGFCKEALKLAVKEDIHTIFPLMREGNLYSKILDIMVNDWKINIKIIPLWVSRMSSYMCMCYDKFDKRFLYELCRGRFYALGEAFKKLCISEYDFLYKDIEEKTDRTILESDSHFFDIVYNRIINLHLDEKINRLIKEKKELLSQYLTQSGAIENFLTMDIGSLGTLPQAIDNCSRADLKKIHLFMRAEEDVKTRIERGHDIRFLFSKFENYDYDIPMPLFSHLFETFTMGEMKTGTVIGYHKEESGEISVVNKMVSVDSYTADVVQEVQRGILDFTREYCKIGMLFESDDLLKNGMRVFCRLMNMPNVEEVKLLGKLVVDESASGESFTLISNEVRTIEQEEGFPQKGNFKIERMGGSSSIWIQGKLVVDGRSSRGKGGKCKYAVYGCGYFGKLAAELLLLYSVDIKCIIDRKLAGKKLMDYPIIDLEKLKEYDVEHILIASIPYAKDMADNIEEYAKRNNKNYVIHYIYI